MTDKYQKENVLKRTLNSFLSFENGYKALWDTALVLNSKYKFQTDINFILTQEVATTKVDSTSWGRLQLNYPLKLVINFKFWQW